MKVRVSFDTINTSLKNWSKNWSTSKNERRSKTHLEEYMYSTNTYLHMGPHKFMRSCIEHKGERERVVVSFVLLSRQSRFFFFDERGGGGGGR